MLTHVNTVALALHKVLICLFCRCSQPYGNKVVLMLTQVGLRGCIRKVGAWFRQ